MRRAGGESLVRLRHLAVDRNRDGPERAKQLCRRKSADSGKAGGWLGRSDVGYARGRARLDSDSRFWAARWTARLVARAGLSFSDIGPSVSGDEFLGFPLFSLICNGRRVGRCVKFGEGVVSFAGPWCG